jgi:hypothetical protein
MKNCPHSREEERGRDSGGSRLMETKLHVFIKSLGLQTLIHNFLIRKLEGLNQTLKKKCFFSLSSSISTAQHNPESIGLTRYLNISMIKCSRFTTPDLRSIKNVIK